jgi:Cytochrome domain of cellobiose dehydrogenase
MRYIQLIGSAVALAGIAYGQTADSKITTDPLTKITYSSYTSPAGITYGVALPMNVSDPYDAIISITAPVSNTTWAGFAWGGTMVWNPLTVGWANGKTSVVSSRFALYDTP